MSEVVTEEHDIETAASEPESVEATEQEAQEPKMVPLAAMLATRKKLQEAETRATRAEAAAQVYAEQANAKADSKEEPPEDPSSLVEKKDLYESNAMTKREILETLYRDMNPEAVQEINQYLKPILEKKPWLAASVDSAGNRYARAHEIVKDYMHLVVEKPVAKPKVSDAQRIVQNSQKPRSPADSGKSQQPSGVEFLKSVQGTKEFREYRQQMLQGRR